jgi:hypothetical protein
MPALRKLILIIVFDFSIITVKMIAGPPFFTDDPEPVEFKHWEYYLSSADQFQSGLFSGTLPHFEVNYGLISNLQIHLVVPMNYNFIERKDFQYGYANTEFGVKYRFIQETDKIPQAGIFPIIEIPTIKNSNFSDGKVHVFLPVWLQKSFGKFTSYGGCGYNINPGTGNKNWIFAGLETQYNVSDLLTLGCELYHTTAQTIDSSSKTAFNFGGFINFSSEFHIIFSIGHSLRNERYYTSYFGLLWTI